MCRMEDATEFFLKLSALWLGPVNNFTAMECVFLLPSLVSVLPWFPLSLLNPIQLNIYLPPRVSGLRLPFCSLKTPPRVPPTRNSLSRNFNLNLLRPREDMQPHCPLSLVYDAQLPSLPIFPEGVAAF